MLLCLAKGDLFRCGGRYQQKQLNLDIQMRALQDSKYRLALFITGMTQTRNFYAMQKRSCDIDSTFARIRAMHSFRVGTRATCRVIARQPLQVHMNMMITCAQIDASTAVLTITSASRSVASVREMVIRNAMRRYNTTLKNVDIHAQFCAIRRLRDLRNVTSPASSFFLADTSVQKNVGRAVALVIMEYAMLGVSMYAVAVISVT